MDVGHELRQARERRDMSRQKFSRITKISPHVLQVIEASDGSRLPARVFTRGFVRSYALEVGLDPDDAVRRYCEQFEPEEPATPPTVEHAADPSPAAHLENTLRRAFQRLRQGRFGTAAVLILVGLTIVMLTTRRETTLSSAAPSREPAVATAGFVPAGPVEAAAVGTSGTIDALHVAIAPTGPCWVQATIDDTRVFGATLNTGDRRTIDAPSAVTLRIGDPATFAFTINGHPARVVGASAHAVTVRITRDNYTQFLSQ